MLRQTKIYFWISFVTFLIYLILLFFLGSNTFADALRGYEILIQYQEFGLWNRLSYPADLLNEVQYFVSWWSPGQWYAPYLLIKLTGLTSLQLIQTLIIVPSLLLCIFGYTLLFKRLGFSSSTRWLAVTCIITNQLFYWQTLMYYGGDLLLLAIFPFFILLIIDEKQKSLFWYFSYIILVLLGLFAKNTFVILILCSLVFMLSKKGTKKNKASFNFTVSIISLALISAFYFLYLKWGETPGGAYDTEGYNGIPNDWFGDLFYSIGSPFGIFSRVTFILQKMAGNISLINAIQIIPASISILFIIHFIKKPVSTYQQLILKFTIPFLVFFCVMFFLNQAVSYEMRHFAPIAFLFFPGFIDWMLDFKWKNLMRSAIFLFCFVDLIWYGYSVYKLEKETEFWNTIKVSKADAINLDLIEGWDKTNEKSLILIEDYWALNIAARKNKKVVLQKDNSGWKVVSGMELDHPDYCKLDKEVLLKNYEKVLLVTTKKSQLYKDLIELKPKLIASSQDFNFYEINWDGISQVRLLQDDKQH